MNSAERNVDPDESAEYKKAEDAICAACEVNNAYKKWKEAIEAKQGILPLLPLLNAVKWHMEKAAKYEAEAWSNTTKADVNRVIKAMEAAIKDMESTGTTDSMKRMRETMMKTMCTLNDAAHDAQESSLAEYNTLRTNMGLRGTSYIIPWNVYESWFNCLRPTS